MTVQWPWQGLHSLSALVSCFQGDHSPHNVKFPGGLQHSACC